MAITLEEMRAGRIDPNTLDAENRASIGKQLEAERDAAVTAERKAADAAAAAANRQRSKDPNAVKGLPRDAVTGQMLPEGAVSEAPEGGLEKAQGLRTADAQRASNLTQDTGYGRGTAKQEQNKVVEMLKSQPVAPKQPVGPHAPTASEAISPGLSRSAADNTAAQKVAAQQSRVSSGATAENIQNIETGAARAQTNTAIGEATGGARPLSGGAGNQPILDPRGDQFDAAAAGRELDPESRAKLEKIDEGIAANTDRQNRAADTIKRNEAAGTPDSREAKAARQVMQTTETNLSTLEGERIDADLSERKPGGRPVSSTVEAAGQKAKDPLKAADDLTKATRKVFEEAGFLGDKAGNPESRVKKMMKAAAGAPGKVYRGAKTLGGKIAPSKSAEKEAKTTTAKVRKGVARVAKLGGTAELVNALDDFGQQWSRVGFEKASDDMYEGAVQSMSDMMTRVSETPEGVERDGLSKAVEASYVYRETMMDMLKGFATTVGAEIPKKLFNFEADLADAMGMSITDLRFEQGKGFTLDSYVKPEGFSGFEGRTYRPGIDAQPFELGGVDGAAQGLREGENAIPPSSPEFIGPGDPGELPGRPGERFDPQGSQALDSVTTDPFLEQGAGEGQFNVGLRGNIDAGNATGGAGGFAQRVEESRRSGAYEPVSQARRTEAQEDLGRIKRGTAAIRDLAASRMGVPPQYLDAVRSGAMTPREANLAQAKQNATGNAQTGMTESQLQDFQINASKEGRAAQEFAQKMDDASIERFKGVATEVADSFPDDTPERKLARASEFTGFAAGWVPDNVDPNQLGPQDLQTVKGQFILASSLADQGEGWVRSLMPWKADITAESLFTRGENILESMTEQGEWFDVGNDNLKFVGRASDGESVTLTIEPEKLHPVAQQMVNQARGNMNIRAQQQGLR